MRILHAEDDSDNRELLAVVLSYEGWHVTSVSTAHEAYDLASSKEFDLFILDSWMPGGSGSSLCEALRLIYPNTPILFYSAEGEEDNKRTALASGANSYLMKPAAPSEPVEEIRKLTKVM
jgi:DNA-binding response OmpR family regulator